MLDVVWRREAVQYLVSRFARSKGLLIEPIGHIWAAFSPLSGETTLLNDESVAVLEVLLEVGASDADSVALQLAADSGMDVFRLRDIVEDCWPRLVDAGLVRQADIEH